MEDRYFGAPGDSGPDCMERREFLKLGGVRLAGAAAPSGGSGPLRREFEAAAAEYGVPVEALLAMGYVNTRWEMPDPGVNAYEPGEAEGKGTYGVMTLVQYPTTDTLGDAAGLAGISEARLKSDRAANIRGGAALLAEAAGVEVLAAAEGFAARVSRAKDDLEATNLVPWTGLPARSRAP